MMVSAHQSSWRVNILSFALISAVFYVMAYSSVSDYPPNAIPVHHDDYTNYSVAGEDFAWSWIRPLSTWLIFVLSSLGPDWLIWAVRLLTATYVFLCWKIVIELLQQQPSSYWIKLFLFAMASLSSPIIVEYARYTGMVTHMMSGCLGLAAIYFLFKDGHEDSDALLYVSMMLLLLSAMAKEDFILFYAFSYTYVLLTSKKAIKKRALIGLVGLAMSLMMVAGAKILANSSFLGVGDPQSSYFIDTSPTSVATTVWRYLTGAGHPAMEAHGSVIAAAMSFSSIVALIVVLRDRAITKTVYVIGAVLTLIAPYSVLPNHVNAYYELIWLPFIIGSVLVALAEAMNASVVSFSRTFLASALFALLCTILNFVDIPGRLSVAKWYDAVGTDNAKVFKYLEDRKAAINAASSVCVFGASAFSPWYMHNGLYLRTVIGLHTVWNIIVDKGSPYYSGFQQGAASSKGQVVVANAADKRLNCLTLSAVEAK